MSVSFFGPPNYRGANVGFGRDEVQTYVPYREMPDYMFDEPKDGGVDDYYDVIKRYEALRPQLMVAANVSPHMQEGLAALDSIARNEKDFSRMAPTFEDIVKAMEDTVRVHAKGEIWRKQVLRDAASAMRALGTKLSERQRTAYLLLRQTPFGYTPDENIDAEDAIDDLQSLLRDAFSYR